MAKSQGRPAGAKREAVATRFRNALFGFPIFTLGIFSSTAVFAAGVNVNYGTPQAGVQTAIITPLEGLAGTIRLVLFGIFLLVGVIGILLRMMVHNPQLQMTGTKAITTALESILVLAFLPMIISWLSGFNIPLL